MSLMQQPAPVSPLSVKAPLVRCMIGDIAATGDTNLLLHAGQAISPGMVKFLPQEVLYKEQEFYKAAEEIERSADRAGRVTIFLTWGGGSGVPYSDMRLVKEICAPALVLNLNNDFGGYNKDMREWGVDLQVSPRAFQEGQGSEGVCYLDALPAARPSMSREQAAQWFRENHDLTLKSPVTLIAIGATPDYFEMDSIVDALPEEGTVLVTTGPRTGKACALESKSPRLSDCNSMTGDGLPNSLWRKLYQRADLFHVFRRDGENPYLQMLAGAERAITTSDSISLPSDCVAARVPQVLTADGYSIKRLFPQHLLALGYAAKLNGAKTVWPEFPNRPTPNEVLRDRVAALIVEKFGVMA